MIVLKELCWSDIFSYGPDNKIDFSKHELLQLIGKNGHGKSSIALILEEVLYNKNSKNIKKADILNRYSNKNKYSISLTFSKDADDYKIITSRGSTQTVQLLKNGEDISAHTATATYKLIEEILGFDHKTFTQIVYQSNAFSLEFLVATDTNRKKFLIELLKLSLYTKAAEVIKSVNKEVSDELDSINLKINTINNWIAKTSKEDLSVKEPVFVPTAPTSEATWAAELRSELNKIDQSNRAIIQNNTYKKALQAINLQVLEPPEAIEPLKIELAELNRQLLEATKKITTVPTVCSSCGQPIDATAKLQIVEQAKKDKAALAEPISILTKKIADLNAYKVKYDKSVSDQREWEKYHSLINPSLPAEVLDPDKIKNELLNFESIVKKVNSEIEKATKENSTISAHNARVEVIRSQLETMNKELDSLLVQQADLQYRLTNLGLLVKTFSTTGLVAYKIECLVKDLEDLTNQYLVNMSDGRFQLSFKINSSDKLNVVINDNGQDIDILALSNGERARVNIATLLAIRKLMQTISSSRINLLILDETIESLDVDGKERLVEILLAEEHLNTVLVSHGFTHPLLEKVSIVKENNISRIE